MLSDSLIWVDSCSWSDFTIVFMKVLFFAHATIVIFLLFYYTWSSNVLFVLNIILLCIELKMKRMRGAEIAITTNYLLTMELISKIPEIDLDASQMWYTHFHSRSGTPPPSICFERLPTFGTLCCAMQCDVKENENEICIEAKLERSSREERMKSLSQMSKNSCFSVHNILL